VLLPPGGADDTDTAAAGCSAAAAAAAAAAGAAAGVVPAFWVADSGRMDAGAVRELLRRTRKPLQVGLALLSVLLCAGAALIGAGWHKRRRVLHQRDLEVRVRSARTALPGLCCVCGFRSVCVPACLRACVPACLRACMPACLRACVPACLPVCLPACLPAYLPVCLPATGSNSTHLTPTLQSRFAF
jgi:hypothetical protein